MNKEIIEAMKVLKENCEKNLSCKTCCFYNEEVRNNNVCKLKQTVVGDLDIPEQQEEIDIQGIEEIIVGEITTDERLKINEIIRALKQLEKTTIKVKVEEK